MKIISFIIFLSLLISPLSLSLAASKQLSRQPASSSDHSSIKKLPIKNKCTYFLRKTIDFSYYFGVYISSFLITHNINESILYGFIFTTIDLLMLNSIKIRPNRIFANWLTKKSTFKTYSDLRTSTFFYNKDILLSKNFERYSHGEGDIPDSTPDHLKFNFSTLAIEKKYKETKVKIVKHVIEREIEPGHRGDIFAGYKILHSKTEVFEGEFVASNQNSFLLKDKFKVTHEVDLFKEDLDKSERVVYTIEPLLEVNKNSRFPYLSNFYHKEIPSLIGKNVNIKINNAFNSKVLQKLQGEIVYFKDYTLKIKTKNDNTLTFDLNDYNKDMGTIFNLEVLDEDLAFRKQLNKELNNDNDDAILSLGEILEESKETLDLKSREEVEKVLANPDFQKFDTDNTIYLNE
ncbi:MAG: hypothetical protein H6621_05485 [Halobacteriovoraceae bacterium]|nr:hypothetical protein [Halobacteriovoraceae bacterium]